MTVFDAFVCYPPFMRICPEDLRRYARRDWGAPERLARSSRAAQPIAKKIELAIALYEAARSTTPEWPDTAARKRDLASHVRVRALLSKAVHVGTR